MNRQQLWFVFKFLPLHSCVWGGRWEKIRFCHYQIYWNKQEHIYHGKLLSERGTELVMSGGEGIINLCRSLDKKAG